MGKRDACRFMHSSCRKALLAHMDQAAKERSRGEHEARRLELTSITKTDTRDGIAVHQDIRYFAFDNLQVRELGKSGLHCLLVQLAVGLGARSAYCGAFAAIEQPKLDSASIGNTSHQTVKSVNLTNQVPLPQSTNRRIARHGTNRGGREGDQRCPRTTTRGGGGCLAACMAGADDDDIIFPGHGWILSFHVKRAMRNLPDPSPCFT